MTNRYSLTTPWIVLLLFLFSCEEGDKTIGTNFVTNQGAVIQTDTFTVSFSSFLLDSVITSNQNVALVGSINDKYFGSIHSQSYIVFGRSDVYQLSEEAVFDSLVLELRMSGYYYGDTISELKFSAHRINQKVEFPQSGSSLYNTSNFTYDPSPVGSFAVHPKPVNQEKISTHLSPALGEAFLQQFQKFQDDFTSNDDFVDYFNGFVFVPNTANVIVGFDINDTSCVMKMYYHISGEVENESQEVDFKPYQTNRQFNQILSNRDGTITSKLNLDPVVSEITGGCSFVQGGTGIVSRVDFPSLSEVFKSRKNIKILKAELVIQPIFSDATTLPPILNLYYTNKHNDFLTKVTSSDGSTLEGNLDIDEINNENTTYRWDISAYVDLVLGDNTSNLNGLLIVPEDYSVGFEHVVLADQLKSKCNTKLILYTIAYE